MEVGGQRHAPAALPPGMIRYPLYRRLGRPQGRSGRVLKISPPPAFDPRTAQLVASRYVNGISIYFSRTAVIRGTLQDVILKYKIVPVLN